MNRLSRGTLGIFLLALIPALSLYSPRGDGARSETSSELPFYAEESFTPHWFESHDEIPQSFHRIGSFALVDQEGRPFTEAEVEGEVYVANFFFTACPGICPSTMASMSRLQEAFAGFDDVLLVSHSVTPEADSVAQLQAFAQQMQVVSDRWRLLTGDRAVIYDLGKHRYFTHEDEGEASDQPMDEVFLHTESFVLVDRDGHIRGVYNGMNQTAVTQLVEDATVLREEVHWGFQVARAS